MILVISTELNERFSVAIGKEAIEDFVVVEKQFKQSELLLKTISKVLNKQKLEFEDILGIVVVSGPGAFSALRIGVTTANALGFSLDVPVVGVEVEQKSEKARELQHIALLSSGQAKKPARNATHNVAGGQKSKNEKEKLGGVFEKGVKLLGKKKKFDMMGVVVPRYGKEPNITIK